MYIIWVSWVLISGGYVHQHSTELFDLVFIEFSEGFKLCMVLWFVHVEFNTPYRSDAIGLYGIPHITNDPIIIGM